MMKLPPISGTETTHIFGPREGKIIDVSGPGIVTVFPTAK